LTTKFESHPWRPTRGVRTKYSLKYLYKEYNILVEISQEIEQTILKVIGRNCKRIFAFTSNEV
jgi:hypothetical protein